MRVRKALAIVAKSVHEVTDTYGSPSDRRKVRNYVKAPLSATFENYLYVGRVKLANFYALASNQFDKASLWQEVQDQSSMPKLAQPRKWGVDTPLMDLALWIHAHA